MMNGSNKSRETLKEFLRKRVEFHPGISIQKLTGHLSQLPAEIRMKYGGNVDSIRRVLEQFPDTFVIRNHDQVHVTTSKSSGKTTGASSSADGRDDETTTLTGAKGKVDCLFKTYGFISVQHPISTSVYFSLRSFENGQHSSLLSSGLQLGDGVVLDAEVGPNECEAEFRASRVARIKGGNAATPSDSSSPASQTPVFAPLVNRTGAIETLKDEFGFIKLEKEQECAFFHAAEIERHLGTAVPVLPEVLAIGDKIRFDADLNKNTTARAKWVVTTIHSIQNVPPCHSGSETKGSEIALGTTIKQDGLIQMVKPEFGFIKFAKPSQKPSEKVKWQATTVWLSEFGPKGDGLDSADESGNEVFFSDDESDIRDLIYGRLAADTDDDMNDDILGAGSRLPAASANTIVDGLKQYLRPVSPDLLPLPKDTKSLFDFDKNDTFSPVPQSVEPSIVIFRGATGLVTDITDFGGTIEVQDQACSVGSLKVNFLTGVFYSDGVRCTKRLCEVLGCGDVVSLDFMVGSNGGHEEVWCDLVWQGGATPGCNSDEPRGFLPSAADQGPRMSWGTLIPRLAAGVDNRPMARGKGRRGGHCMSAHTSISNSINLHRRRSHHSPPAFPPMSSKASPSSPSGSIHGDRATPNGICVGNSLATSALFSNDISGTVLRRVARMMAEELHVLQHQERLAKGSVRDVATQTTERGMRSVP
ncbi:hypothetical protein MRX96_028203 [Rhipicephalus microplus]